MLDAISDFLGTYLRGGWLALLDIVLVAIIIYWVFILIRGTRAVRIVIGLSILYLVYLVADAVNLQLLSDPAADRRRGRPVRDRGGLPAGAAARAGADRAGRLVQPILRVERRVVGGAGGARDSRAARLLAGSRHGALIVIERGTGLQDLATDTGVPLHADLRAELLATIFYHGTALHDGAVIISGEKITAAAVVLPLSQNVLDSERYGTRHRAAIGISEQSDALVVVVSEETGSISLVQRGRIERNLTEEQLRRRIFNLIRPQAPSPARAAAAALGGGRLAGRPDAEPEAPIDPEARVVSSPARTAPPPQVRRRPARHRPGPSIGPGRQHRPRPRVQRGSLAPIGSSRWAG